jgi:hypothetical protein
MRAPDLSATRAGARIGHETRDPRSNERDILDELFARLDVGNGSTTVRATPEFHLDVVVRLRRLLAVGRWMTLRTPGRSMLVRWLAILVLATKGSRLAVGFTFELFDTIGQLVDEFFKFLNTLTKRLVFRFELLNPKVAWVGVHAIFLASRNSNVTSEVCTMNYDRASKILL